MSATHEQVFRAWFREKHKKTPKFIHGSRGNGLHVNRQGVLMYGRTGGYRRTESPYVEIARWIGGRNGFLLMNAEAFRDWHATNWQNRIRNTVGVGIPASPAQRRWMRLDDGTRGWVQLQGTEQKAIPGVDQSRALLVPFAALTAAEIEFESIKPIEILADLHERREIFLEDHPRVLDEAWAISHEWEVQGNDWQRIYEGLWKGNRWRITVQGTPPSAAVTETPTTGGEGAAATSTTIIINTTTANTTTVNNPSNVIQRQIWERPEHGVYAWQTIQANRDRAWWVANIHRMGSSVFSARIHGRRYRFVSAFDQNEPSGLYFLAMLPFDSKATTVEQAIDALAPPLVHAAWEKGIHVERQGDVFAIQTNMTDEQVYEGAVTRVRRQVVMQSPQANRTLEPPAEGEVREKHNCPHCGEFTWMGFGPKAKKALMIHYTGHTADEVVVKPGGVTFIRGAMHHDPALETEGRRPDHVRRALEEGKWYLAVRNTVPKQRNRRQRGLIARQGADRTTRPETIQQAA